MNKITFLFLVLICVFTRANAQSEQLLVDENFQSWTNMSATASSTIISKTTQITNETLNYTLWGVSVLNSNYVTSASANYLCSAGYLKMVKNTEITSGTMSIELSPLASITKIWFVECTTGSNRGFKVWKKNKTDADWVPIYSTVVATSSGVAVNLSLNDTDVALKFTNLSVGNYAFLTDLKIWGNVSGVAIPPTVTSITPAHNGTIPNSGNITIVYSENVKRASGDILLGGVVIPESAISIQGATVTIAYSGLNSDSSYAFVVPAGAFINDAGTPTSSASTAVYKTVDTIFPVMSKISLVNQGSMPTSGFISLVMSEDCKAGSEGITLAGKTITPAVSASNNNLIYINYSGLDYDTDYTLTIPANSITDLAGNSIVETTINFHTEIDAKGSSLLSFIPDATSIPATASGDISYNLNAKTLLFGGVASPGARNASPYTYAFKCNYVELPELPSVGELSFYIQCGGGTSPQEFYIQKLAADGVTWHTIETFILGTNDKNRIATAAAQSSVPSKLRLMYNGTQFWLYNLEVYGYTSNIVADDGLIPSVDKSLPNANATDVVINGMIKLTFSEIVNAALGAVTLDGKTLTPSIVGKSVTFTYSNLKYATSYVLNVPAGAFKDAYNNPTDAFTFSFTTKAKPIVTPRLFNFVVAKDGSGDGTTIQSAFDAVPMNNAVPFLIFVKNGTYNEYPTLAETKNKVSLIGQTKNDVVITGDRRSGVAGYTTSTCQTVEILADQFYCENLTIKNTAGVNAGQAVALKVYADKAVFKNVKLTGYQDTHLTSNNGTDRQYYLNCEIQGTVDFIFGNGVCYFDNCKLYLHDRNTANVIVAPATTVGNVYGYVFNNTVIDGASSQDGIYNLGRPWQNAPRAVFLNTKMNILSSAGAWGNMSTIPALFAEYNTLNAANNAVSLTNRNLNFSYVDASNNTISGNSSTAVLTESEAANYTVSNVLGGSDSWEASAKTEQLASPTNLTVVNNLLSWDAVEGAVCYVVLKDDVYQEQTVLTTANVTNGKYQVLAVTENGALSIASEVLVQNVTSINDHKNHPSQYVRSTVINNTLEILMVDKLESMLISDLSGRVILCKNKNLQFTNLSDLSKGYYILQLKVDGKLFNVKLMKL